MYVQRKTIITNSRKQSTIEPTPRGIKHLSTLEHTRRYMFYQLLIHNTDKNQQQ